MKLRTKLKISFFVLAIIPMLLLVCVMVYIGNEQIKNIEQKYDVDNLQISSFSNPTRIYSELTQKAYDNVLLKIHDDVDGIDNTKYLDTIKNDLKNKASFIILKKDNQIIYDGSKKKEHDIVENLPDYRGDLHYNGTYASNSYIYGDYKYLVKQISFRYSDNTMGNFYIITGLDELMPQIKRMFLEMFISIVFVLLMTSVLLTLWIYRSVMKPLNKLTIATRKIAQGDLDFILESEHNDEFGELCDDFENMRKRLKESASDKLKDDEESKELISNISHDLKTPITAIKGYVEGIMDGVADTPEKMDKYIKTIYNKANDMDRLIGELTLYSKIDTNRIPYNFKKVNVDDYFSDCAEEISIELEAKNIRLNYFNYVDKSTIIIADPEQLKRVINNIISNSVKYIGNKQGALNIRISDENDFIHVEIEDNGKGIDTKDLPYIFDRFYRTDISRNSNQGGSGIGLAIVKKIIEVHGGKIWATSQINTGTIMHFVIRKYIEPEVETIEQDIDY